MKKALILGLGVFIVLVAVTASAQSRPTTAPAGQGTTVGPNFVDNNGDGICDNFQAGTPKGPGQGRGRGYGRGMGNGTHVGPQDGTGFGPGAQAGGGTCDGTGPEGPWHAARRRRSRRYSRSRLAPVVARTGGGPSSSQPAREASHENCNALPGG